MDEMAGPPMSSIRKSSANSVNRVWASTVLPGAVSMVLTTRMRTPTSTARNR